MKRIVPMCCVLALTGAVLTACGSTSSGSGGGSSKGGKIATYAGIPTQAAAIFTQYMQGVNRVATTAGASGTATPLVDNSNPQTQLQLFSNLFAKGCAKCAMTALTISSANQRPIALGAGRANAYITFVDVNRPGYFPWSVSSHFVAFLGFDSFDGAYQTAKALFQSMGGKGNVIELDGTPGAGVSGGTAKAAGFHKALAQYPMIHLLASATANFVQAQAQSATQTLLTKYGSKLNGIWSANDAMAIGAVQALKGAGLEGKVPVTGMDGSDDVIALIKKGDMVATMYNSGALTGAVGTALSIAAASGAIDPAKLTHAQRYFYLKQTLVDKQNADAFYQKTSNPEFTFANFAYPILKKNLWAYSAGPIPTNG